MGEAATGLDSLWSSLGGQVLSRYLIFKKRYLPVSNPRSIWGEGGHVKLCSKEGRFVELGARTEVMSSGGGAEKWACQIGGREGRWMCCVAGSMWAIPYLLAANLDLERGLAGDEDKGTGIGLCPKEMLQEEMKQVLLAPKNPTGP